MELVDLLRGVAILAMLIAHGVPFLWPTGTSRPVEVLLGAINDVASPLFGLVMGAAATLVWSRTDTLDRWPRRALADIGRGVLVFALGVLLVQMDTWVAIVLHVLGVLMVLGLPAAAVAGAVLRAGASHTRALSWSLWVGTAAAFATAPWLTGTLAPEGERTLNGRAEGWAELWVALMAGTSYRAVSLLPFFMLGAALAAAGLLRRARLLALIAGAVAAVLGVLRLLGVLRARTLSGDVMDQWWDLTLVALALAVVAAVLALGGAGRARVRRPVAELGAVALSVYALQIVVLKPLMDLDVWQSSSAWGWVCLLVLVVVPSVVMVTWRRLLGPGPLETLVALVTGKGRAT